MPVVTPFGEFTLGDEIAEERWLDAHDRRHVVYVPLTGTRGGTLDGPVNGDWMLRHAGRHSALATFLSIPMSSADTKALALGGKWRTQQQLIDWMDLHNRLHLKIDRQLKLRVN